MTKDQEATLRAKCGTVVLCATKGTPDETRSAIDDVVRAVDFMQEGLLNPCPQTCSIVKSDTATVGPIFCTENANYAWRRQDGTVVGVCWQHAMALHLVVERLVPAYDTVVEILKRD